MVSDLQLLKCRGSDLPETVSGGVGCSRIVNGCRLSGSFEKYGKTELPSVSRGGELIYSYRYR